MRFVTKTDVGVKRNNNEDSYFAKKYNENVSLFVVADGLGGYEGGEIASKILTIKFSRYFEEHINEDLEDSKVVEKVLLGALEEGNRQIYNMEKTSEKYQGMGTTIVLVALIYDKVYYLSVGDSRLYYIDKDMKSITQVTEDDTYVNTLLKTNVIDESEIENHPQKHVLTKAIGIFKEIKTDVNVLDKKDGFLVLCTDGLTNMLNDKEILKTLKNTKFDLVAQKYIKEANANGGVDNTTVAVIEL